MSYSIGGDYFEACNCNITCRCIYGTPFDGEACDGFFAWHIEKGRKDPVDLSDLAVAMARHRPRDLTKDRWLVELYLDERARPEQAEALEMIFGGSAGGHIGDIFRRIGALSGVARVPIVFEERRPGPFSHLDCC